MMKNDKFCLWQVLLPLLPLLMILASCRKSAEETADNLRIEKLHQLDELLNAQSPQAKTEIEKGMKLAKDSLTFYEYYARKGRWFCQSATPDSTVGYVDRTLRFALRQPDTPRRNGLLAYTYNCQGINYHNFHRKADEVVSLYQSAYAYSMRSDVQHQAPSICANLGDAYLFKNQLPQAASWYRRALFLVDSLQLPKEENVSLYVGLATIYLKLNDFDASLQCYQQTEDHLPQMSLAMQAYYLNNYGNYYYYKKDYAQSLRKFLQLKQLLEKHKKDDCFDMYLCKLNMADVYLNLDSIAQSEKYLAESEPFMVANHDVEAVYYCNTIHIGQEVKKGDMAAVTRILDSERQQFGDKRILHALATAGLIGNIAKSLASISGAEAGCQAEVGVACAMAAAAANYIFGGSLATIEYSAEMGLEHHFGMTCDPICGLVQIPCIERNAHAAARALDANIYATYAEGIHRISYDKAVEVMKQTGHDLPSLYRETSEGGLAKEYNN